MGGAVSARRTEYGKAGAGELPAPAFPKRNGRDVSVPLRLVEAPGPLDVLGDLPERASPASISQAPHLARSPRETIPTTLPASSTGSRRTCFTAIIRAASAASSSGETTAQFRDMMSLIWTLWGSSSAATHGSRCPGR